MVRRALYGGERGIQNRSQDGIDFLRLFAKSDFKHDFGEDVSTRDKYVPEDIYRFLEICQKYGLSKVAALRKAFDKVIGNNPYKLLKDTGKLPTMIFPVPGDDNDYQVEDIILEKVGINYRRDIKDPIKRYKSGKTDLQYLNAPCIIPNLRINGGNGVTRTYTATSVPLKVAGKTPNIATMFGRVSNNNTNFALIIDAAGGLSLTSIRDASLEPYEPEKQYTFLIIENIENDSDSATKLKHLDKSKRIGPDGNPTTNVNIGFLRDTAQSVVYHAFVPDVVNKQLIESQTENLFGNAQLTLSRSGDETEADFIYPEDEEYHIENVSQNANVKNASLNMIASLEAQRGREAYLYAYLKRVGDWCQALSLLDTSRDYDIVDEAQNVISQNVTLKKLQELNTTIALVTLDRILLAYALHLGIDVFFTSGTDISSLIYFKNTEIQLEGEALSNEITRLEAERDNLFAEIGGNVQEGIYTLININPSEGVKPRIEAVKTNPYDIRMLRSFFSNVSMLRLDFDTLHNTILEGMQKYNQDKTDGKNVSYLTDLIVSMKKYKLDKDHNDRVLSSIDTKVYPDFTFEKEIFDAMGRSSRNVIAKLREIISKKLYTDVIQVNLLFTSGKLKVDDFNVASLIPTKVPADPPALQEAFPAFSVVYSAVAVAPMKGGGIKEEVNVIINNLSMFEVTPINYDAYKSLIDLPEQDLIQAEKDYPPAAILYSYYRDDKGFPYTVYDNYLITKEDIPTYKELFTRIRYPEVAASEIILELCFRFLLLYCDILKGRYERLIDSEDDYILDDETQPFVFGSMKKIESDVKFSGHKRIHYQALKLQDLVNKLKTTPLPELFVSAWDTYNKTDSLDNSEIDELSVGRGSLRSNEYSRTCNLIKTIRDTLLQFTGFKKVPFVECPTVSKAVSTPPVRIAPKKDRTQRNVVKKTASPPQNIVANQPAEQPYVMTDVEYNDDTDLGGGSLQPPAGISTNVESIDIPGVPPVKHPRLRKRARTRRAARVRQSTRKSTGRR